MTTSADSITMDRDELTQLIQLLRFCNSAPEFEDVDEGFVGLAFMCGHMDLDLTGLANCVQHYVVRDFLSLMFNLRASNEKNVERAISLFDGCDYSRVHYKTKEISKEMWKSEWIGAQFDRAYPMQSFEAFGLDARNDVVLRFFDTDYLQTVPFVTFLDMIYLDGEDPRTIL